jgi:hypothetical protein
MLPQACGTGTLTALPAHSRSRNTNTYSQPLLAACRQPHQPGRRQLPTEGDKPLRERTEQRAALAWSSNGSRLRARTCGGRVDIGVRGPGGRGALLAGEEIPRTRPPRGEVCSVPGGEALPEKGPLDIPAGPDDACAATLRSAACVGPRRLESRNSRNE